MARGKHQRSKHAATRKRLLAEINQLHAEIAAEQEKGREAARLADETARARARLKEERQLTERRLHTTTAEAARRAKGAITAREDVLSALRELRRADDELYSTSPTTRMVNEAGRAGVKVTLKDIHRSAPASFRRVWARKHLGEELDEVRHLCLLGWIPEQVENTRAAHTRYMFSTAADINPEACWSWAIPPWMGLPTGADAPTLRAQFGATTAGAPLLRDRPYPGRPLAADAVLTTPWRHSPMIGHTADVIDEAYWYQRSAWAQGWRDHLEAVPMVLPSEHATSFPAARPLPPEVDLRLPFPLVYASLSSSWRIEANRQPYTDNHFLNELQMLLLFARGRAAYGPSTLEEVLGRLQALGLDDRAALPTPLEFLDAFGGYVDGLLLTADKDGIPCDEFAWCVVVNHPLGFELGRWIVPASRARSGWRRQVDNVIAGIALSCWHEAIALPARAAERGPIARFAVTDDDPEGLRVLDIDATSPAQQNTHGDPASPGHSVRPHLRRGHWRDQRVGQGRNERRLTWVRPSAVHGGLGGSHQIYVLRR